MRRLSSLALTVGLIVVHDLLGTGTRLAAAGDGVLKIRIYNYARVPPQTLQIASRDSAHIFENAGFASNWQICRVRERVDVSDDPGCAGALDANEFSVRIMNGSTRRESEGTVPDILGYAMIPPDHFGVLATVLFQRICTLAERSATDVASLLGRVMAHEVGHLALGSTDHTRAGLMRAVWKLDATGASDDSDWNFSRKEAARMKRRLGHHSRY